jgi:hypothetical protein
VHLRRPELPSKHILGGSGSYLLHPLPHRDDFKRRGYRLHCDRRLVPALYGGLRLVLRGRERVLQVVSGEPGNSWQKRVHRSHHDLRADSQPCALRQSMPARHVPTRFDVHRLGRHATRVHMQPRLPGGRCRHDRRYSWRALHANRWTRYAGAGCVLGLRTRHVFDFLRGVHWMQGTLSPRTAGTLVPRTTRRRGVISRDSTRMLVANLIGRSVFPPTRTIEPRFEAVAR